MERMAKVIRDIAGIKDDKRTKKCRKRHTIKWLKK